MLKALLCILLVLTINGAVAKENKMEFGLYVAVADLAVSKIFYSKLFQSEPVLETPTFVKYQVGGGSYGLILESVYSFPLKRGNNTVPNIKVKNIELEFERIKTIDPLNIQDKVTTIGPTKIFMFSDPDGNVIEFFSFDP